MRYAKLQKICLENMKDTRNVIFVDMKEFRYKNCFFTASHYTLPLV
jgi:hypothetical protein